LHDGTKYKPKVDHVIKNDIQLKFKMAAAAIFDLIKVLLQRSGYTDFRNQIWYVIYTARLKSQSKQ